MVSRIHYTVERRRIGRIRCPGDAESASEIQFSMDNEAVCMPMHFGLQGRSSRRIISQVGPTQVTVSP